MHMAHIVREMRGVAPTANGFFFLETYFFRIRCPRAISYTTSAVAISAAEKSPPPPCSEHNPATSHMGEEGGHRSLPGGPPKRLSLVGTPRTREDHRGASSGKGWAAQPPKRHIKSVRLASYLLLQHYLCRQEGASSKKKRTQQNEHRREREKYNKCFLRRWWHMQAHRRPRIS
jgi:hypothetical protein